MCKNASNFRWFANVFSCLIFCYKFTGFSQSIRKSLLCRSEARQRAGRAGRTSSGKCFRIYSREFWEKCMPDYTVPEVQRTSLTMVILTLKCLGVHDVIRCLNRSHMLFLSLLDGFQFSINLLRHLSRSSEPHKLQFWSFSSNHLNLEFPIWKQLKMQIIFYIFFQKML